MLTGGSATLPSSLPPTRAEGGQSSSRFQWGSTANIVVVSLILIIGIAAAILRQRTPDFMRLLLVPANSRLTQWRPETPWFCRIIGALSRSSTTTSTLPSLNRSPTARPRDTRLSSRAGPARLLASQKVPSFWFMDRVHDVVLKVRALRELTTVTGTITKRSQGLLLQALTPEELTQAAQLLMEPKEGQTNEFIRAK